MTKNIGQNATVWTEWWKNATPESQIRMWDFYGGRQWILKFVPRYGKVLEAGCGLGRYVFYLSKFGIDIDGLDFTESTINLLNLWKRQVNSNCSFIHGDIKNLPYYDNTIAGYLSFGVIEHFIEGPAAALNEAYRVLRPGGIAVITTPNISWYHLLIRNPKKVILKPIKKILKQNSQFFQYEYRPRKLKRLVEKSGLKVMRFSGADLLYSFYEWHDGNKSKLLKGSFAYWFSNTFENSRLCMLGSQSITISIKVEQLMHCFFCGRLEAEPESLKAYDVPICMKCISSQEASLYAKIFKIKYSIPYLMSPDILQPEIRICDYCNNTYQTDFLFESFGFNRNVCPNCMKIPKINMDLACHYVAPLFR